MRRPFSAILLVSLLVALPATAQQGNTAGVASLTVAGLGAAPAIGPFTVNQAPGGPPLNTSFVFSGAANSPFVLVNANPAFGGVTLFGGGIPVPPFGILDIGPLAFPPLEFPIDGIAAAGTLLGALYNTGTTGSKTLSFTLTPASACGVPLANVQAAVVTIAPPGLLLTAAFAIGTPPVPPPDAAPVPVAPAAGDDTTHPYCLAGGPFSFYGVPRFGYNINSNGNITFGGGFTTFSETQALFNGGLAKICAAWDDFNFAASPVGAALTKFDTGATVTVAWTGVSEFGAAGTVNTFSCVLSMGTGDISFTYTGPMSSLDSIVGITPGGGLAVPVTVFGPGAPPLVLRISDHLAGGGLGAYVGGPMESMNELFAPVTLTTAPFNLLGATATFMVTGPTSFTLF
jgi:hypothetical protein